VRRTLELADPRTLDKIARARARVRNHFRSLIAATSARSPWLAIAGRLLAGWLVIDLDATLITAHSDKKGAAPTFKKSYGLHPAWGLAGEHGREPGDAVAAGQRRGRIASPTTPRCCARSPRTCGPGCCSSAVRGASRKGFLAGCRYRSVALSVCLSVCLSA
jgi:hypothetical protein